MNSISIGLAGALLLSVPAQRSSNATRFAQLPAPTGTYAVGRVSLHWIDSSRNDAASPSGKRELMVYAWYPATTRSSLVEAPYIPGVAQVASAIGDSAMRDEFRAATDRIKDGSVSSHAVVDAPAARARDLFPILLFSPGFGESSLTYTAILGDLASHGYVVFAIEHPGDTYAVLYPGGRVARFAQAAWDSALARPRGAVEYQIAQVATRANDIRYVLHHVARDNDPTIRRFLSRADVRRIGAFGHSLGGLAAAEACRDEPLIRTCMNIDAEFQGVPWIDAGRGPPVQPFAFLATSHSLYVTAHTRAPSAAALASEGLSAAQYDSIIHLRQRTQDEALASVRGGSYRIDFEGPEFDHRSFLDLPLLGADAPALAQRHAGNLVLARQYSLAYFDATIRRRTGTLLTTTPPDSTGTRIEQWNRDGTR